MTMNVRELLGGADGKEAPVSTGDRRDGRSTPG